MSAESPVEIESEIRWPDPERGPYLISVRFRASAEDWQAVGLGLGFAVEPEARSLRTSDLRKLRLPLIIEQAAAKLRGVPTGAGALPSAPRTSRSHLEYLEHLLGLRRAVEAAEAALPRPPGRPATPLRVLQEAARLYAAAFERGEPPTRAVAEGQKISYAAASRRIARARELGLLGLAERGKAGVGVLLQRGDTQSLASEIARLKELEHRHEERQRLEAESSAKVRPLAEDQQAGQS
jgi:hypothetical protein